MRCGDDVDSRRRSRQGTSRIDNKLLAPQACWRSRSSLCPQNGPSSFRHLVQWLPSCAQLVAEAAHHSCLQLILNRTCSTVVLVYSVRRVLDRKRCCSASIAISEAKAPSCVAHQRKASTMQTSRSIEAGRLAQSRHCQQAFRGGAWRPGVHQLCTALCMLCCTILIESMQRCFTVCAVRRQCRCAASASVVVTREHGKNGKLMKALAKHGVNCLELPLIEHAPGPERYGTFYELQHQLLTHVSRAPWRMLLSASVHSAAGLCRLLC